MALRRLYHLLRNALNASWWISFFYKNWLNIPMTVVFNFYSLPFSQAVKLPIWLYGNPKLLSITGKVSITSSTISPGMIKINRTNESLAHSGGQTEIINKSEIIFRGTASIGTGCRILVYSGKLIIGDSLLMMNRNNISCSLHIEIGSSTNISTDVQISDTNFHFLYDTKESAVSRISKSVVIGDFNWIGNRASIMKGTTTPKHTTIASNSLLNKAYEIPECSILAGTPAKIVKTGFKRIRNYTDEIQLIRYFIEHPDEKVYKYNKEQIDDSMFKK